MTDRATRDRLSLLRAAQALTQVRELDALLGKIMDEVTKVLGADRSTLFLLDETRNELVSTIAQRAEIDEIRLPVGKGLAGHVAKTGTAVATEDAYEDPRFTPETDRVTGYATKSVACAPMITSDGHTVGVIEVMNKLEGSFDADDVKLLTAFANYSAVAIEKARLFEEVKRRGEEISGLNRQLREALDKQTRRLAQVEQELSDSRSVLGSRYQSRNIVGRSSAAQELHRMLDKVSGTNAPVLIQGESGTGKELVARAIHFGSSRAAAAFVSENCGAVAESLLEAELFGHKRGAFTGADRDRVGLFEQATGGTLFLDEVGDMSLEMQKKLLRALQEGEIRPVGARDVRKVDVRIVAASNKDLEKLMKEGKFREDLFYRLNVIKLVIPPLRDRREDIPLLVDHFLKMVAEETGKSAKRISEEAMKLFVRYGWPGNVRELQNEIRRAVIMGEALILPEHLSPKVATGTQVFAEALPPGTTLKAAKRELERRMILEALARSGGKVTDAARELGLHRPQLSALIKKYKIDRTAVGRP